LEIGRRERAMNHDVLMAVFMLVTIPPLLVIMWWSRKGLQGIDWEHRFEVRERLLMARLPHAITLWRNLLEAFRDNKPEEEKKKCAKQVYDYIELMTK